LTDIFCLCIVYINGQHKPVINHQEETLMKKLDIAEFIPALVYTPLVLLVAAAIVLSIS
jgi:hypothetical protein